MTVAATEKALIQTLVFHSTPSSQETSAAGLFGKLSQNLFDRILQYLTQEKLVPNRSISRFFFKVIDRHLLLRFGNEMLQLAHQYAGRFELLTKRDDMLTELASGYIDLGNMDKIDETTKEITFEYGVETRLWEKIILNKVDRGLWNSNSVNSREAKLVDSEFLFLAKIKIKLNEDQFSEAVVVAHSLKNTAMRTKAILLIIETVLSSDKTEKHVEALLGLAKEIEKSFLRYKTLLSVVTVPLKNELPLMLTEIFEEVKKCIDIDTQIDDSQKIELLISMASAKAAHRMKKEAEYDLLTAMKTAYSLETIDDVRHYFIEVIHASWKLGLHERSVFVSKLKEILKDANSNNLMDGVRVLAENAFFEEALALAPEIKKQELSSLAYVFIGTTQAKTLSSTRAISLLQKTKEDLIQSKLIEKLKIHLLIKIGQSISRIVKVPSYLSV